MLDYAPVISMAKPSLHEKYRFFIFPREHKHDEQERIRREHELDEQERIRLAISEIDWGRWCNSPLDSFPVLQDPLAIMGIVGLLSPFVILGIAIATGVVDVNKGRFWAMEVDMTEGSILNNCVARNLAVVERITIFACACPIEALDCTHWDVAVRWMESCYLKNE
jgi:hypothetical protein